MNRRKLEEVKSIMSKQTAEIKRQVKNAIIRGDTLPYSLRTLIEAGISVERIKKVIRPAEMR